MKPQTRVEAQSISAFARGSRTAAERSTAIRAALYALQQNRAPKGGPHRLPSQLALVKRNWTNWAISYDKKD
jgi:hypothetical protein